MSLVGVGEARKLGKERVLISLLTRLAYVARGPTLFLTGTRGRFHVLGLGCGTGDTLIHVARRLLSPCIDRLATKPIALASKALEVSLTAAFAMRWYIFALRCTIFGGRSDLTLLALK